MDFFNLEKVAQLRGYPNVAGVDEAGRGPLAGPVVAAACMVREGRLIDGVDDSKSLPPKKRADVYRRLISSPNITFGIGIVDPFEIDQINVLQATFKAMCIAVDNLKLSPDYVLVDGSLIPSWVYPSEAIVGGDGLSYSIAAASIIAKETRDRMMCELDAIYPKYGFAKHKGYGTKMHLDAIKEFGPCDIHRFSFEPIKTMHFMKCDSN